MALTTTNLATTGMHCRSCSMLIDMTVGELEGVTLVQTDHAEGRTVVTYDDEAITVDAIIDAIRGAGYDASVAA